MDTTIWLLAAVAPVLLALIVRGVAFEFRSKDENPRWRTMWDWAIFIGSFLGALLLGVAVLVTIIADRLHLEARRGDFDADFAKLLEGLVRR